ncbi:hypothetical protein WME75_31690 [Sorangium sp. So ce1014]|uniref:hypothetical protein n=1 Tax=Sorangium sp. So ce1014 TaxID=3133326 RepID=UPI003F62736F
MVALHECYHRLRAVRRRSRASARKIRRATTAIIFIGLASCRTGGTERCTEAACRDELEIKLEPGLTAPGHYQFKVELDGVTRRCDASLPSSGQQETMAKCIIHEGSGSLTAITIPDMRPKGVALHVARDHNASWSPRERAGGGPNSPANLASGPLEIGV